MTDLTEKEILSTTDNSMVIYCQVSEILTDDGRNRAFKEIEKMDKKDKKNKKGIQGQAVDETKSARETTDSTDERLY